MTVECQLPSLRTAHFDGATHAQTDGVRRTWHRIAAGLAGTSLYVLAGLLHRPELALVGMTAAALALTLRWLRWQSALPAAVVGLLGYAVLLGSVAAGLDVDLLSDVRALVVGQTLLLLVLTVCAGRRADQRPALRGPRAPLAFIPAAVAGVIGAAQSIDADLAPSWTLAATDIAEHAILLGGMHEAGNLSYAGGGYPRAVHMLLALGTYDGGPPVASGELLRQDVQLLGVAIWLGLAVLLWTAAAATLAMGRALGRTDAHTRFAAGLVGWLILSCWSFQMTFVHMGSLPGMLALVVLWCVPLSLLTWPRHPERSGLLATVVAGSLIAHLWQALVLGPAVAFLALLLLPEVRSRVAEAGPVARLVLSLLAGGTILVGVPPLISVQGAGGLSLASVPGQVPAAPAAAVLCALASLVVLIRQRRSAAATTAVVGGGLGMSAAVLVLAVSAGDGLALGQYYPVKATWFLVLFLSPCAALLGLALCSRLLRTAWSWADSQPRLNAFIKGSVVVAATMLLAGLVIPGLADTDSMLRVSMNSDPDRGPGSRRLDIAVAHAHDPAVAVPIALGMGFATTDSGSYVTSKLLRYQTGQTTGYGVPEHLCDEVVRAAGRSPAVVLTDLPAEALRPYALRGGCGDLQIMQVPGAPPDLVALFVEQLERTARE